MTNPTTPTSDLPKQHNVRPSSFRWGLSLLTLIFRLLLLGVGSSVAAAVGIAVAQLYPAQVQEPPLAEKLIQSSGSLLDTVRHLPKTWNQPKEAESPVVPSVAPSASAPVVGIASPLSETERKQLQTELTKLQAELQTLTSDSKEPLADRVQDLQKRIQAIQEQLSNSSSSASPQTFVAPATSSTDANRLMVTLPSDALFEGTQTTLRPGSEAILNNILTDLQRYPEAAIQVGAHTDNQGSAETDRHRSLEQAKAVQQYLSTKLGDEVHWVTVGYGHNRPIAAADTPENRQRNRRIEILIDPQ